MNVLCFIQLTQDFLTLHEGHSNFFMEKWPTLSKKLIEYGKKKANKVTKTEVQRLQEANIGLYDCKKILTFRLG